MLVQHLGVSYLTQTQTCLRAGHVSLIIRRNRGSAIYQTRRNLGFKAIFFSNNLGAYRRLALEAVGNFPARVITAEDSYTAARMMIAGWQTAYVAEAAVYHSHNQSLTQLFRRYFDTGVMHARESWMLEEFGEPAGEGMRFVRAEVRQLLKEAPMKVPIVALRSVFKFAGYPKAGCQREEGDNAKTSLKHGTSTDLPRG